MGATSRYCLPQLIRRGEYDPTWLDTGMPLTESLETQAFVLHSVTDLELMPKRRRLEPPSPTPVVDGLVAPSAPTPAVVAQPAPTPGAAPEGVDLSHARIGGSEWGAWATAALDSAEGAEFRSLFGATAGLTPSQLDDRVTDRLSAFCEVCMSNYVPRKGYVLGFQSGLEIDRINNRAVPGGRNNLVCLECLPAERPLHLWTN